MRMREPSFGRRATRFGRRLGLLAVGAAVLVLVLLTLWSGWSSPTVRLAKPVEVIGRATPLELTIEAGRSGLRSWRVLLRAGDTSSVVAEGEHPRKGILGSGVRSQPVQVVIDARAAQLAEGPAELVVQVRDHSPRAFVTGASDALVQPVTVDLTPPSVTVQGGQHYLTRGGSDAVVYTTSDDVVSSGVLVGDRLFPGDAAVADDPSARVALYTLPHDAPPNTRPKVVAEDAAGNRREVPFPVAIREKTFPAEEIVIGDQFLAVKVPEILEVNELTPASDPVASYLLVNRDLRRRSEERIKEVTAQSEPRLLLDGAFRQQPGSQVGSRFAEHRTYRYNGEVIDTQVHLGYDLASVKQAPVYAGNAGKVSFVGNLGIYGTAVIIDHGLGLSSLYAHLSSTEVTEGQEVAKGAPIGRTGETGLAGGDHLHFSIMVRGTHVDPVEWWDPKWLKNRILAQLAPPAPPEAPAAPAPAAAPEAAATGAG